MFIGEVREHIVNDCLQPRCFFIGEVREHINYGRLQRRCLFIGEIAEHIFYGCLQPRCFFIGEIREHIFYGCLQRICLFIGEIAEHISYGCLQPRCFFIGVVREHIFYGCLQPKYETYILGEQDSQYLVHGISDFELQKNIGYGTVFKEILHRIVADIRFVYNQSISAGDPSYSFMTTTSLLYRRDILEELVRMVNDITESFAERWRIGGPRFTWEMTENPMIFI